MKTVEQLIEEKARLVQMVRRLATVADYQSKHLPGTLQIVTEARKLIAEVEE